MTYDDYPVAYFMSVHNLNDVWYGFVNARTGRWRCNGIRPVSD